MILCQVCTSQSAGLKSIERHLQKFYDITGIIAKSESLICDVCVIRLDNAIEFREQALNTFQILESQNVVLKDEPLDIVDDIKSENQYYDVKEEKLEMEHDSVSINQQLAEEQVEENSKNSFSEIHTVKDSNKIVGCPFCFKNDFTSLRSQQRHIRDHIIDAGGLRCELCGEKSIKYLSRIGLAFHMRTVHLKVKIVAVNAKACPICGILVGQLTRHMQCIHGIGKKSFYECDLCGKTFARKVELRKHIKFDHLKINECDICHKRLFDSHTVKIHRLTHSNVRNHVCPICQKAFTQRGNLLEHIDKHDPGCKYLCDICGKLYRSNFIQKHRDSHDPSIKIKNKVNEVRPFECKICNLKFKKRYYLVSHEKTHNDRKEHSCEYCNQYFKTKSTLKMHLRLHTGESMFPCTACDKKFNSKYRLKFHVNVDHCGMRYDCDVCGKSYTRHFTLTQHKKRNHGTSNV